MLTHLSPHPAESARTPPAMHSPYKPDLPTELVLLIQGHMTLPTLVAARGVCRVWRSLIPGPHIPPARRALLALLLDLLASPAFLATRPAVLPHLRPFSRAALLARLPPPVPADFRTWVLEWPARAALGHVWPALACAGRLDAPPALHADRGASLLFRHGTHILNGLRLDHPAPGCMETEPFRGGAGAGGACGLLLDDACVDGWQRSRVLVLCGRWGGVDVAGRVYQVDGVRCRLDEPFAASWVAFLRQELEREERWLREHGSAGVKLARAG